MNEPRQLTWKTRCLGCGGWFQTAHGKDGLFPKCHRCGGKLVER